MEDRSKDGVGSGKDGGDVRHAQTLAALSPLVRTLLQMQYYLMQELPLLGSAKTYNVRYAVDLAKGLTLVYVALLMVRFGNYSIGAWTYLALHGSYAVIWVAKDNIFPDPKWNQPQTLASFLVCMLYLFGYWFPAYWLISEGVVPPNFVIFSAVFCYIIGVVAMTVSDAQKYYTLKYRKGLITEGMFSRTRNPNYLGEMLVYGSFALVSYHWQSWIFLGITWSCMFLPNMLYKDQSMSRYPEWKKYKASTGLLLPSLS